MQYIYTVTILKILVLRDLLFLDLIEGKYCLNIHEHGDRELIYNLKIMVIKLGGLLNRKSALKNLESMD